MHELGVAVFLAAPRSRQQIYKEGKDVESEDKGDDPLENGRDVLLVVKRGDRVDDGENDLHYDEDKFEPEREAEDAMLAEVHAEALVLGANEDGADDITGHEQQEKAIVKTRMVEGIEDGEEDQAAGSGDGEDDCNAEISMNASHSLRSMGQLNTY